MTDYTDLIVKVRMIASILRPLPNIRLDECDALDEAAVAIAALTAERDALRRALDEALTIPYWGDAQDDHTRLSGIAAPKGE